MAAKFITEILQEVNDDLTKISKYPYLKTVFSHAFLPEQKFILPEGTPPYTQDAAPQGLSMSNFFQEIRRLYIFTRADLTPLKREGLFISMLEGLHPSESEVLLLIKDQNLTSKYPNLTTESVAPYLR